HVLEPFEEKREQVEGEEEPEREDAERPPDEAAPVRRDELDRLGDDDGDDDEDQRRAPPLQRRRDGAEQARDQGALEHAGGHGDLQEQAPENGLPSDGFLVVRQPVRDAENHNESDQRRKSLHARLLYRRLDACSIKAEGRKQKAEVARHPFLPSAFCLGYTP